MTDTEALEVARIAQQVIMNAEPHERFAPHPKVQCPHCQKLVKEVGLREHIRFMHEGGKEEQAAGKFADRLLTSAEFQEIETRADLDFIDRRRMTMGRMHRALKDREMLLGHIHASKIQPTDKI